MLRVWIPLLGALAELVRYLLRRRDRARAEMEATDDEENLRKIEEAPAGWMAEHFGPAGGGGTVRPCDAECGLREPAMPGDDVAPETGPSGTGDGGGRDVP